MGKRLLTCLLVAAMVLLLLPMQVFADESYQVMTVDKTSVNVGDTVNVKVVIPEGIENAGSFTVALNFDPTKFEVVSRNENSEIAATDVDGNAVTVAVAANDVAAANNSGSLRASAVYSENTMQVAGFTAIDATLKAVAAGNADFAFEVFEVTKSVDGATQWIVEDADVAAPPVVIAPVNYTVELDPSTLEESTEEQTVVMTVKTSMPVSVDGVGMTVMIPEGWSLAAIENETLGFGSDNVNLANGMVNYFTSDAENLDTELIAKVTYTVPANAAAGAYQLGIKDLVLSADHGVVWEDDATAMTSITVEEPTGVTVSGTISGVSAADSVTVELYKDGQAAAVQTATVTGNGTYSFDNVEAGTYTIKASCDGYEAYSAAITVADSAVTHNVAMQKEATGGLKGDVNLDGEVTAADLTALACHVAKISTLTDATALANADTNSDGDVTAADLTLLAQYVAKIISSFN